MLSLMNTLVATIRHAIINGVTVMLLNTYTLHAEWCIFDTETLNKYNDIS